MILTNIQTQLFQWQDKEYANFMSKLMPTVDSDRVIGVRTPVLRTYAKELLKNKNGEQFIEDLPHYYFEENQLHSFILSLNKSFADLIPKIEAFLPYIDNWATCDMLSPAIFKKECDNLLPYIYQWITSTHPYTVRFAISMLMKHFLDHSFQIEYPELVVGVETSDYYVKMMIAWYFATALAKQYDLILPYIENDRLEVWTHNKTIQKAVESRRLLPEQKKYLKSLRRI
ncbi:MAG: DNA alkylation repair protein [Fastidiosipilaceae bacterium]|mgnify:CR=1 FL=1|nr:DNA alkylation repair protein [Clostridiaceae bacterium]